MKSYIPIYSTVIHHGLINAAVYGCIWSYTQMSDNKICTASISKIADRLNLSRMTIIRSISYLLANKLIMDHTPNLRNHTHTLSITIPESDSNLITIPESDSTYTTLVQPTVPGCDLNKLLINKKIDVLLNKENMIKFTLKSYSNSIVPKLQTLKVTSIVTTTIYIAVIEPEWFTARCTKILNNTLFPFTVLFHSYD